MSSFAPKSVTEMPTSHAGAVTPVGKSSGLVLPPSVSVTKAVPQGKTAGDAARIPHVTLSPASRVALVQTLPSHSKCIKSNRNDSDVSHAPQADMGVFTSALTSHSDQREVGKRAQASSPSTEERWGTTGSKQSNLQVGKLKTPSVEALGNAKGADTRAPKAAYQGVRGSPSPTTKGDLTSNKAAAAHHLQPIVSPLGEHLSTTPPAESSGVVGRGKREAPLATVADPVAAAGVAGTPPTAGSDAGQHGRGISRFSLLCTNLLSSPHGSSSDSDSSDGSPSEDNRKADFTSAVNGQKNMDGKTTPKSPPANATSTGGQCLTGAAASTRRGLGFSGVAQKDRSSVRTGCLQRGVAILSAGDGSQAALTESSSFHLSKELRDGDKRGSRDSEGQEKVVAIGRRFRRTPDGHGQRDAATHFPALEDDKAPTGSFPSASGLVSTTRQQLSRVNRIRESFFELIPRFEDVLPRGKMGLFDKHDIDKLLLSGAPCSWLCCASLAIDYVSGVPTSIETMLRANRLCIHYISLPTVTLAELFDTMNDYIHICRACSAAHRGHLSTGVFEEDSGVAQYLSKDELKKMENIHCEMATFYKDVLDSESGEDIRGMGEHPPVTSLSQFRKELLAHIGEERSMYIFNYNPYLLEQSQLRRRGNFCDNEEDADAIMRTGRFTHDASCMFAIMLSFDPVENEVKIMTPHITAEKRPLFSRKVTSAEERLGGYEKEGEGSASCSMHRLANTLENIVMEEQVVSLQSLYESVHHMDAYSSLSLGFVRVFGSETDVPEVPSIFPLCVLDGSSAGGLMTSVLNVKVAPHLLGLAMLHHLSITFLISESARRKQSSRNLLKKANACDVKLRGIPLTKVCQQLQLPLSMIVGQSTKGSIAKAYVWYHAFLRKVQIQDDVHIGLILSSRRDGAADGQPNITDSEFLRHLRLVVQSRSVMLISFDINIAFNVLVDDRPDPAHFAIVIGVDEKRGIARLADVNVKRFRKTWHISISRLYNAIMGYGYILASKERKVIKSLNGKEFHEEAMHCAQNFLPPLTSLSYQRFEYPSSPYPVTVLADAVEQLGFQRTSVENFINFSGFHISYFLSAHMPLEGAALIVQNYVHYALDDAMSVSTVHYDFSKENPPPREDEPDGDRGSAYPVRSEEDLVEAIQYAMAKPEKRRLIIKYDVRVLQSNLAVWNGNEGSSFAIVMHYEAATKMVVLSNASPSSFYRVFFCPVDLLFEAVCSWDRIVLRAGGTILLSTETTQETMYEDTRGYDMAHALVYHPFRPMFSSACSCLALAATEMMMNIVTPNFLEGDRQKRKVQETTYKRYNNIFSAEDFLYAQPSFSVREWRTRSVDIQELVGMANNAFKVLRLPLHAVDLLQESDADCHTDPMALLRGCSGVGGVVTVTLLAYDTGVIHGVPGVSVGLVNRVSFSEGDDNNSRDREANAILEAGDAQRNSVGSVQILEGDPCRWGSCFDRSAEELSRALKGLYRVEECVND